METIDLGKYVELVYDLYEGDEPNEVLMYQFNDEQPDNFVFGLDSGMLEAFKNAIKGKKAGDEFDIRLTPDQAFGEVMDEYIMEFDHNLFEVDGVFDEERIKPGNTIEMMTQEGQRVPGEVISVTPDKVKLDFNHPLAGENIRFKGKVKTVRQATPEELAPKSGCHCGDHDHGCGDGCGDGCNGCH